jgi:4-hydroxy-tetrahydrodipicolinate reductase
VAAEKVPLLLSPNMSMGINLLAKLVEQTSKTLPLEFQIEIIEAHHQHKQDAPSGTAIFLGKAAAKGRDLDFDKVKNFTRSGTGKRKLNEIGIEAIRGGDIVGEHTVFFIGEGERLELIHRALSRDTFAAGAIKAAEWLVGKPAGLYDMLDVLNLKGHTK